MALIAACIARVVTGMGFGIGMEACRQIVGQMGGFVEVKCRWVVVLG